MRVKLSITPDGSYEYVRRTTLSAVPVEIDVGAVGIPGPRLLLSLEAGGDDPLMRISGGGFDQDIVDIPEELVLADFGIVRIEEVP